MYTDFLNVVKIHHIYIHMIHDDINIDIDLVFLSSGDIFSNFAKKPKAINLIFFGGYVREMCTQDCGAAHIQCPS